MIKTQPRLNKFYRDFIKREHLSYKKALSIYEALHNEAVSLGIINSKNILEGIDIDIRIAKTLNAVR